MEVIIKSNYQEMSLLAAKYLLDTVKGKSDAVIGLPTGSTPLEMYSAVVEECRKNTISFQNVKTFNLDEYIGLGKTDENSYYYFMNTNLFSHIDIKKENIHIPDGMTGNVKQECTNYENKVRQAGSMDILFLGIGKNGHIGFNEPGDFFEPYTHEVKLQQNTINANSRFFESTHDVPTTAITMGIKTILSAKKIVLLAEGESKAEAVEKMVNGKITPRLPASILQLHDNITVIIDKKAAGNL